ncbi:MAG: hypothetical protein JXA54_13455 [Candidatus Heimdallarchaeota archaeon]|nr:hypothetical protein [Candidatus Heimdallarchaeota archaeon]
MELKLIRASIVILAEAHNPSIISPDWIAKNSLIPESPITFIHTPDLSGFDSKSFNLVVDRQRLQLTAKKTNAKITETLTTIIAKYFELLPHIPYLRLGINFDWIIEEDNSNLPQIKTTIGKVKDYSNIFPDHDLCFGSVIHAKKDPYNLRLSIEPTEIDSLTFRFNYEYKIQNIQIDKILELLNNTPQLYNFSNDVVKDLCSMK